MKVLRILSSCAALLALATSLQAQPPGGLAPLGPPPMPPANPITPAKANLGKALFWDEQLSSTGTVSCGTCHMPERGGSDPRSLLDNLPARHPGPDGIFGTPDDRVGSPGVPLHDETGAYEWQSIFGIQPQVTPRKATSAINAGYSPTLFWDGRALPEFRDPVTNEVLIPQGGALESQAAAPPLDGTEMSHIGRRWSDVAASIAAARPLALATNVPAELAAWIGNRRYPALFEEAFGTPEVTPARILFAIATYERTLVANQTPHDIAAAGGTPLTPAENRGRQVFINRQCNTCHGGPLLSDNAFHYTGVRPPLEDIGREGVTGQPGDRARMRTPPLRNIELRAPYMHNGRFASLEEVVDFYNRGGDFNAPNKAPQMVPLNLTPQERADLLAFLRRPLTDPRVAQALPPFDRPMLYTESDRVPVATSPGVPGTGGLAPMAVALEPPHAGNGNFTVGIWRGRPGATATLVIAEEEPPAGGPVPRGGPFAHQVVTLSANGHGSASLALPDLLSFVGRTYHGRWYVEDPEASGGLASSGAFRFRIFATGDERAAGVEGFVFY